MLVTDVLEKVVMKTNCSTLSSDVSEVLTKLNRLSRHSQRIQDSFICDEWNEVLSELASVAELLGLPRVLSELYSLTESASHDKVSRTGVRILISRCYAGFWKQSRAMAEVTSGQPGPPREDCFKRAWIGYQKAKEALGEEISYDAAYEFLIATGYYKSAKSPSRGSFTDYMRKAMSRYGG